MTRDGVCSAPAHALDAMPSTADEQPARRGAVRGASPHVAVQHHGYFIVMSLIFLRHTVVTVG